MYADDVILLSENAQGLQSCLDKLQSYCDYWGLQVNIKKTKSLVFNNTGRLNATKFTFNGAPIESVRKYSYLELPLLFLEILQMLKPIYTKRIKGLL